MKSEVNIKLNKQTNRPTSRAKPEPKTVLASLESQKTSLGHWLNSKHMTEMTHLIDLKFSIARVRAAAKAAS